MHEYGKLEPTASKCDNLGREFRPLEERNKKGRLNPFQDPERGRIPDQVTDSFGNISDLFIPNVLLNLSGKNSIIGKSIAFKDLVVNAAGVPSIVTQGCCVIGYDKPPNLLDGYHHDHKHSSPVAGYSQGNA